MAGLVVRKVVKLLKAALNPCAPEYVLLECGHKAFVRIGSERANCVKCAKAA